MKNVWSLLSFFVLSMLSGVLRVHGQASLNDASFRTEGGITYAVLNCSVDACYSLSPQRLTRSGHQIDQALATARADFCVCDITFPCPAHNELATCPLGALEPGDYQLFLRLAGSPPEEDTDLLIPFNVPANNQRTLTVSQQGSNARIDVAGVPNAKYVVESSSTLTNWTEVVAYNGAPFTYSEDTGSNGQARFFRVRIEPLVVR